MHPLPLRYVLLASLLTASACDGELDSESSSADSSFADDELRSWPMAPGTMWGPCDTSTWGEWGCAGSLGVKLACLRPLYEIPLSICVPQTADDRVDNDCGNMWDPGYAHGVELHPSEAYCVGLCDRDAECPQDLFCSTSGMCAWHE